MNLVLVTQDFPPEIGGIHSYCFELGKRFEKRCDTFTVIAPDHEHAKDIDSKLGYRVIRIRSANILLGYTLIPKLGNLLKELKADVVFHAQWNTLIASLTARRFGFRGRIYCAAHGRELLLNPSNRFITYFYSKYRKRLLGKVDAFYSVSTYTGELLKQSGVGAEKIRVIPNGTDPDIYFHVENNGIRKRHAIPENAWMLITTARLVKRKGIEDVIDALEHLTDQIPRLRYMIVGDGPQRQELEQRAASKGLASTVCFTGKVPYDELKLYYSAADAFVMVPRTLNPDIEGFGLVYLEANSCGLPVISSDSAGVPDAVVDGVTGIVVPEGNIKALTEAVLKLYRNPELAQNYGQQGRERVLKTHNWDNISEKMLQTMGGDINDSSL